MPQEDLQIESVVMVLVLIRQTPSHKERKLYMDSEQLLFMLIILHFVWVNLLNLFFQIIIIFFIWVYRFF